MKLSFSCLVFLPLGQLQAARFKRKGAAVAATDCHSMYDGKHLLSLSPCGSEIQQMQDMIDGTECKIVSDKAFGRVTDGGCADEQVICPALISANLTSKFEDRVAVESVNAGAYMRQRTGVPEPFDAESRDRSSFYNSWRSLSAQLSAVDAAVANSGGACKLEVIGTTHEGRQMRAVRVRGANYSPGGPRVVATFGIHAREWVAQMSGVYAVEQICARAKSDASWLRSAEVVMIPMGNPDGFEYSSTQDSMWRKNRRQNGYISYCDGVDLNRNFPKGYGGRYSTSTSICSEVYIGSSAGSEPETQAIMSVIDENQISVLIDVHCYGRVILKPWSYTNNAHPRLSEVDQLGKRMLGAMKSHRNNYFRYGGNELLGPASGVLPDYANGGLGYTYEMTTAFQPSTSEIQPSVIEVSDGLIEAISWSISR